MKAFLNTISHAFHRNHGVAAHVAAVDPEMSRDLVQVVQVARQAPSPPETYQQAKNPFESYVSRDFVRALEAVHERRKAKEVQQAPATPAVKKPQPKSQGDSYISRDLVRAMETVQDRRKAKEMPRTGAAPPAKKPLPKGLDESYISRDFVRALHMAHQMPEDVEVLKPAVTYDTWEMQDEALEHMNSKDTLATEELFDMGRQPTHPDDSMVVFADDVWKETANDIGREASHPDDSMVVFADEARKERANVIRLEPSHPDDSMVLVADAAIKETVPAAKEDSAELTESRVGEFCGGRLAKDGSVIILPYTDGFVHSTSSEDGSIDVPGIVHVRTEVTAYQEDIDQGRGSSIISPLSEIAMIRECGLESDEIAMIKEDGFEFDDDDWMEAYAKENRPVTESNVEVKIEESVGASPSNVHSESKKLAFTLLEEEGGKFPSFGQIDWSWDFKGFETACEATLAAEELFSPRQGSEVSEDSNSNEWELFTDFTPAAAIDNAPADSLMSNGGYKFMLDDPYVAGADDSSVAEALNQIISSDTCKNFVKDLSSAFEARDRAVAEEAAALEMWRKSHKTSRMTRDERCIF
mmetsp:Transcript_7845/g.20531  ORF Transcript_7845/g.20531 Transcript_7845/m.20531 type:complete len:583 (-) Transcript_7845:79-1827(-)